MMRQSPEPFDRDRIGGEPTPLPDAIDYLLAYPICLVMHYLRY